MFKLRVLIQVVLASQEEPKEGMRLAKSGGVGLSVGFLNGTEQLVYSTQL